jgi:lysophospholipase L1-like esterase
MANIQGFIDKIRTAIYGKEVRGSLADGLDAVNKETEKTSKKQGDLEATFDQLIINAGDSNAEVVASRHDSVSGETYDTLPKRLDATSLQLDTVEEETGIYPKQLGAKIDGTTNDTGYINEAIASGKKLIGDGKALVTSIEAPKGFDSSDALKIIRESDGYLFNSYADKYNRLVFGQEYLSYFHRRIAAGSSVSILFSGDSTTANTGFINGYKINELIQTLATNDGFYNVMTVNRGQPGKTSWDWINDYLDGDLAVNADMLVIRWGINDPEKGSNLDDFMKNMRAGLEKIRQTKTYAQMSVVLMMPNTTSDYEHGRSELWYESMVNGLKRLAREFQCVFIDTYAYLQSSRNAYDYMDSAYNGASSIHPKEVMNIWIADIIYETIFPRAMKLLFAQAEPTSLSSSLQNGWSTISNFRTPGYWIENGSVKLRGVILAGTITPGTTIFTLPISFAAATFIHVGTRGGGGVLLVDINGNVKVENLIAPTSGNQWISLEGSEIKVNRNIINLP